MGGRNGAPPTLHRGVGEIKRGGASFPRAEAAIDDELHARDKGGLIARQVKRRRRNLLRRAHATDQAGVTLIIGGGIAAYKSLDLIRRLKQRQAAQILRVSQPRVSDLLRGRIDLFSTDALIDMLASLGVGVRLVVHAGKA